MLASVLTAAIWLAAIGSAPATEDAWILWRRFEIQFDQDANGKKVPIVAESNPLWEPKDSFVSLSECRRQAQVELAQMAKSVNDAEKRVKEFPFFEKMARDAGQTILGGFAAADKVYIKLPLPNNGTRFSEMTAVCHPATFDPRR